MNTKKIFTGFIAFLILTTLVQAQVFINEIHYNPPDNDLEDGGFREFVELYNTGGNAVDLSGYVFDNGIQYTFSAGTTIQPMSYLVIAKDTSTRYWRNIPFRLVGPYEGKLSDSGERLTLKDAAGNTVDTFSYGDAAPWSQGADGYDSSLERIHPELPAADYHSWRASLNEEGTPGRQNSVYGTPPYPLITNVSIEPPHPSPRDSVRIQVTLDAPSLVTSAELRFERAGQTSSFSTLAMNRASQTSNSISYEAVIPPMPSQSMVRANIEVELQDGSSSVLPHEAEPIPFISYFVYDGEIDSTLPILWILPPQPSALLQSGKEVSGAAALAVGETVPLVFDGAILIPSASSREKLRFIKGHELNGDRTINIIPEVPTGGTNAGISSPYREHLGFWFYREMGVPSPWAAFHRVIRMPNQNSRTHTQQLIVQQVNENFLELNNRNPDADLYKLVYSNPNWEKHTNKDEDTGSIEELLTAVSTRNMTARRAEMEARLHLDEFLAYSAASIFVSNWDGYWNNNWMYLDPESQRWEMIPWDLDWIWGATPPPNTGEMYFRMPLSFPIDGVAVGNTRVSRNPGPVTSPMHQEPLFYEQYIERLGRDFHSKFTMDKMNARIDADQQMLLDDLALIQQQTGRNVNQRRTQIQQSYDTIKLYILRRRAYLEPLLPASVSDWDLYAN